MHARTRGNRKTDQPPPRQILPGKKLVPVKDQGVRLLHGAPQARQRGVHLPPGGACAQSLHRVSREGKNKEQLASQR